MNRKLALTLVSLSFILSPIYIYSSIIYTQENVNSFNPDIAVVLASGTAGVSEISVNGTSAIANVTAAETHDFVDNNVSDVDTSADKGTHSNFTAQQYGPDLINDTLAEEGTGGTSTLELWVDNYDETKHDWTTVGTTPYLSSINYPTDYIYTSTTGGTEEKFDFANASATGAIHDVKICVYTRTDGNEELEISIYNSTDRYLVAQPTLSTSWTWYNYSCLSILPTWTQVNYAKLRLQMIKVGRADDVYVDAALVSVNHTSLNYELDLEVQWTNVVYDETSEYLCVYGGSMGSENITIDAWNGSAWKNVFTDLSSGWNNKSVSSYLTSSNFTIRFKGDTETDDTDQDRWDIDATLLHVWTHTYDYILNVTSQKTYDQNITLNLYNYTNIDRLSNCTIWFRDGTTSVQINITNGIVVQDVGPWYILPDSETRYIVVNVEESGSGTSDLFIRLEAVKASSIVYTCLIKLTVK